MQEYDFEFGVPDDSSPSMAVPYPRYIRGNLSSDGRQRLADLGGEASPASRHTILYTAAERRWEAEGRPAGCIIVTAEDFPDLM